MPSRPPGPSQTGLFGDLETARPAHPIYCHQDFLERLEEQQNQPVGKRAALLLYRLAVDERRQFYKSASGSNAGWRRSRLGGNKGSHFYAWWTPAGATPLRGAPGFGEAPQGALFVRDIRHHDNHSELTAQTFDHYLPITVKDLVRADYVPVPWTPGQTKFSQARHAVRVLRGHPGSGKTTALWNAAIQSGGRSVLYVTYSADLAALAQDYFDKLAPREIRFQVVRLSRLLNDLSGEPGEPAGLRECRARLSKLLADAAPRSLGPWHDNRDALFDEIHAHLVGAALPVDVGRFFAQKEPLMGDRAYRERRERDVGRPASDALLSAVQLVRRRERGGFTETYFPEIARAWKASVRLLGPAAGEAMAPHLDFDTLAVDEVQDLTPIEAFVLIELAARAGSLHGRAVTFLAAGDEAQTVRPTDFEWGWFHDLLYHRLGSPTEFRLDANLRSPRRIAELVNRVSRLYSHLPKDERPSGAGRAETDEDASDQVTLCSAAPGPDLNLLLDTLANREGLAVISLSDRLPAYLPERIRSRVFTPAEAKGLDFHSVCVLDAGQHLQGIHRAANWDRRGSELEPLNKRLLIDQLRVAVSRPAERVYFLEVSPSRETLTLSLRLLQGEKEWHTVTPALPAAVLKSLEEELLPVEERIRLCENDARQLLDRKPGLAWVRARQAASLLGPDGEKLAMAGDPLARSVLLTAAQIAFCLAFRRARLDEELGRPDLFWEAAQCAQSAGDAGLCAAIRSIQALETNGEDSPPHLFNLGSVLASWKESLAPWLRIELALRSSGWMESLEKMVELPGWTVQVMELMPELYAAMGVADGVPRAARLRGQGIAALIAARQFRDALRILERHPADAPPDTRAACFEGCGDHAAAAQAYLAAGNLEAALRNFRSVPDLDRALELVTKLDGHPAAESLQWIRRMQKLVAERPANLPRLVTQQEMRYLQEILEQGLGVQRRAKQTRKAAARPKAAATGRGPRQGGRKPDFNSRGQP